MVWELCLHMFVSYGKRVHRAEPILDLGLSMPSPPSFERARPGCMQHKRMPDAWMPGNKRMPGCLQQKWRPGCLPTKWMPGCLTKNGCVQKEIYRIIPIVYRIITYYTVSYPVMFSGTWQLQWEKGLLGPLGRIPTNRIMCSLGPLGSCNGQRGGEGGMSTPGMHKHTHMLCQGGVVATSHTANIHNLSIPPYVIHVLETWAVS